MQAVYDAVVIGSGFGGAVSALRLAEADHSVLVLERGGHFSADQPNSGETFWRYAESTEQRGLYDLRFMSDMATLSASGVGGGSLIDNHIFYRPPAEVFEDPRWPEEISLETLEPCFQRVERMLEVSAPAPEIESPQRDLFWKAAAKMGREAWDFPVSKYWTAHDGPVKKISLCQNYLKRAEIYGAEIKAGHLVSYIAATDTEGYDVHFENTVTGEKGVVRGLRIVLAAGTLGTHEILLRSRDEMKSLNSLSRKLGQGYSANGSFLGVLYDAPVNLRALNGQDVRSGILFPDACPEFLLTTQALSHQAMDILAMSGSPRASGLFAKLSASVWRHALGLLTSALRKQGRLRRRLSLVFQPMGSADRMMLLFAMGMDNANGRIVYREGQVDIIWPYAIENQVLIERQQAAMRQLARQYRAKYRPLPVADYFGRILTMQGLGGCALSDAPASGVVSSRGQVHGHPGLYIADGSVLPAPLAAYPAMTIAALAERIASSIVTDLET